MKKFEIGTTYRSGIALLSYTVTKRTAKFIYLVELASGKEFRRMVRQNRNGEIVGLNLDGYDYLEA